MLTPQEAADVAARHGLSLADAVSLRVLADDVPEADRIAGRFSSDETKITKKLLTKNDGRSHRIEIGPGTDLRAAGSKLFERS